MSINPRGALERDPSADTQTGIGSLGKPALNRDFGLDAKLASGDWLLVRRDVSGTCIVPSPSDERKQSVSRTVIATLRSVPRSVSSRLTNRDGLNITLYRKISMASSANTAYTTALAVQPDQWDEWSSVAALFDEVKVRGGELHYKLEASAAALVVGHMAVVGYDPISSTTLTSVSNGCQLAQHQLLNFGRTENATSYPSTTDGYKSFNFHVLRGGSARSSNPATEFGDEWSSVSDSGDIYGYLQPYFEAGGAGTICTLTGIIALHCRFRSRK